MSDWMMKFAELFKPLYDRLHALILEQPVIAMKLTQALGIDVSPNGVRSMWLRNDMNTTALRVKRSQLAQESA
jgi:hypothetical protein